MISLGVIRSRAAKLFTRTAAIADLVGRVGHLTEHPIHQPAVGAVLGFQSLGHLDAKLVAHLIRGQRPHLGIGSVDLIEQARETARAPPLR